VLTKLEALGPDGLVPWSYRDGYAREQTAGPERLRITCSGGHAAVVHTLAAELRPPYKLLYILHTPRGGSTPGRYESPALDGPEVSSLFRDFGAFWREDARHDVWLHSREDSATIVWDRHDVIYAYGPLQRLEAVLEAQSIPRAEPVDTPSPHAHHYHEEWDGAERALVARFQWRLTPLRPGDEQ